jgi:hypothetical protein
MADGNCGTRRRCAVEWELSLAGAAKDFEGSRVGVTTDRIIGIYLRNKVRRVWPPFGDVVHGYHVNRPAGVQADGNSCRKY